MAHERTVEEPVEKVVEPRAKPRFDDLGISGCMVARAALARGRTVEEPIDEVVEPIDKVGVVGDVGLVDGATRIRPMASSSKSLSFFRGSRPADPCIHRSL